MVFHNNIRVLAKVDWYSTALLSRRLLTYLGFPACFPDNQVVSLHVKPYIYYSTPYKLSSFIMRSNMTDFDCIVGYKFLSRWQISVNYFEGCYVTKLNGIRSKWFYIVKSDTRDIPWMSCFLKWGNRFEGWLYSDIIGDFAVV